MIEKIPKSSDAESIAVWEDSDGQTYLGRTINKLHAYDDIPTLRLARFEILARVAPMDSGLVYPEIEGDTLYLVGSVSGRRMPCLGNYKATRRAFLRAEISSFSEGRK